MAGYIPFDPNVNVTHRFLLYNAVLCVSRGGQVYVSMWKGYGKYQISSRTFVLVCPAVCISSQTILQSENFNAPSKLSGAHENLRQLDERTEE